MSEREQHVSVHGHEVGLTAQAMAFGALFERNRLLERKISGDLLLQIIRSAIADCDSPASAKSLSKSMLPTSVPGEDSVGRRTRRGKEVAKPNRLLRAGFEP